MCNAYDTGQFDDREFIQNSPEILKGFVEMWTYKSPLKEELEQGPNGALRLARYFHQKPKLKKPPRAPTPEPKVVQDDKINDDHVEVEESEDATGTT